jgi:tRNA/rRNA methyltransferase
MVRNIRNIFQRADLTEQEIRTLHGIIKELAHQRVRRPKRRTAQ